MLRFRAVNTATHPRRLSSADFRWSGVPSFAWVAIGVVIAFWPVWRWYVLRLDDGSDEPMGLVALATAGWLLWQRRERLGVDRGSVHAATAGLFGYLVTFPWLSPLPRALAALGVIALGFRLPKAGPGICLLLALSLPVIATAQFYLGWPLRWMTAVGSEALLKIAGLDDLGREGTVLWWREAPVNVDAPCSGVRMLWTGLFMHALLLVRHRLGWRTGLWLTPLVVLLILAANVIRATLLFFKESGALFLPEWTHPGIGLVVFAGLLGVLSAMHRHCAKSAEATTDPKDFSNGRSPSPIAWGMALVGVLGAAWMPMLANATREVGSDHEFGIEFPGWPTSWDGCDLVPVVLAPHERAFADAFPGDLAVFRTTEGPWSRRLIVRWITRPTRKLHSSADCLRAEGFRLERDWEIAPADERWATWTAYQPGQGAAFRVRERLWSDSAPEAGWTEVSAWFWDAVFRGNRGPWWGVTVMEPISESTKR
ncbi:MAG: archaeosortase/exosortase family protein [Verrucomicrobiae bacterium]|nr:archaeosortase/exosortase family protein [Verrucomicrobiae bacterium]